MTMKKPLEKEIESLNVSTKLPMIGWFVIIFQGKQIPNPYSNFDEINLPKII